MKDFHITIKIFLTIIFCLLSSCTLIKSGAAKDAGFNPRPELLNENRARAPFHGYWNKSPEEYYEKIQSTAAVYIAPVDLNIIAANLENEISNEDTRLDRFHEAESLARYFREKIFLVAAGQSKIRFLEEPQANTPILKLALVDIVPTKPTVNILGTIAGFFVPGGGLISYFGEGSIAIEGYVELAESGQLDLWEEYKDKEGQKVGLFSFKDYQKYSHIRVALDDWAMQIVELLTTMPNHKVEDSSALNLNPL